MKYFLGVDAGGSKTHALVVDASGHVLGFGSAGGGNHQVAGLEPAVAEIRKASQGAIAGAGSAPIEHACFCLSGADLEEDYVLLATAMRELHLAPAITVMNDTMAALRAGITRPWGVAVVCGSGFNAAGRGKDGRELILPGLGSISGDWGGGGDLAQEVIRLVMRAWDGRGEQTQLTERVLAHFNVPSEEALLRGLYHHKIGGQQLMELVPLLFEVAAEGDVPARQLVIAMGKEVATTAKALLRRLSLQDAEVEVVLAGGVFRGKGSLLLDTVTNSVHEAAPLASILRLERAPVVGAALLALDAAGVPTGCHFRQNVERTLPEAFKYNAIHL